MPRRSILRCLALTLAPLSACGGTGAVGTDGGGGRETSPPGHHAGGATDDATTRRTDGGADDGSLPIARPPGAEGGSALPPASPDGAAPAEAPLACAGPGSRYATRVLGHAFGPGQSSGRDAFPGAVLGPPHGGGACQGSSDAVSLGNGGWVVLGFDGNAIVDAPGPDFTVFENPFGIGCDPSNPYAELGTVSVSEDGRSWVDFPCAATGPPYGACSGWRVVYADPGANAIDPTDPALSGGDLYDLADLGLSRARYVRITDRADLTGPAGVYDLDAVAIVHPFCP